MNKTIAQKIAIIGSGAVGSYYGSRLAEAGHKVFFLMRSDYQHVKKYGLKISSPDGNIFIQKPNIVNKPDEIGKVDWIICGLKATASYKIPELFAPCIKKNTRILNLMNGLGIDEKIAKYFDKQSVFGGMAFTCINRGNSGVVNHLYKGFITIGHITNDSNELKIANSLWAPTKVQVETNSSLLKARWEKLCWNIPFNGIGVCSGGISTDIIINDPQLYLSAQNLMKEVINIANADLTFNNSKQQINESKMIKSMFDHTVNIGEYRSSTVIDFLEQRTMEVDAIFNEPLRRAKKLNIKTPYLSLITSLIKNLNKKRLNYR